MIDTAGDEVSPVLAPYDETEREEVDELTKVTAEYPLLGARVTTSVRRKTVTTTTARGAR